MAKRWRVKESFLGCAEADIEQLARDGWAIESVTPVVLPPAPPTVNVYSPPAEVRVIVVATKEEF